MTTWSQPHSPACILAASSCWFILKGCNEFNRHVSPSCHVVSRVLERLLHVPVFFFFFSFLCGGVCKGMWYMWVDMLVTFAHMWGSQASSAGGGGNSLLWQILDWLLLLRWGDLIGCQVQQSVQGTGWGGSSRSSVARLQVYPIDVAIKRVEIEVRMGVEPSVCVVNHF